MKYDFDEVIERRGTYCTQWDYIEDRFGEKDLLPFSISDTDFRIPKPISDTIQKVAQHEIYGYTRWNHHDFKGSITGYFQRRFQCRMEEDWILYSPSVMYSVSLLIRLLSKPKDRILSFNPMYDSFFTVIEDQDRILISHDLVQGDCDFEIDFDKFEEDIKDCSIFLLCSPHNPTGRLWSRSELQKMVSICKAHGTAIISDEIHMDMQLRGRHTPILEYIGEYDRLFLVSSCSKTLNVPGLIGSYAVIADQMVRDEFLYQTRKRDFLNSASIFGMYATMVGYTRCDDYVDQLCDYIRGNMELVEQFVKEHFPDMRFAMPQATYLAWIDVRAVPFSSEELQEALVHIGKVAIMKGETYGNNGKGYLRMNCGCPRAKLLEGLQRMKKAVDTLYEEKR